MNVGLSRACLVMLEKLYFWRYFGVAQLTWNSIYDVERIMFVKVPFLIASFYPEAKINQ